MTMRRIDNPPNPYESTAVEWLEPPPKAKVEIFEDHTRNILATNDSPDIGFKWSVNPYRGCQHACIYCYARRTHEYLNFGAGTDFETKLVVKPNAPELLDAAFRKKGWTGERVMFSGVTDCYQPIEAVWKLTRRCLEVCLAFHNPVAIVTKSYMIVRDLDVLKALADAGCVSVLISVPFKDAKIARLVEPQVPPPWKRFEAMRRLADAGIPVGIMIGPIIPGLNDRDVPEQLQRAADNGATFTAHTVLRLPGSVEPVFLSRLKEAMPLRYQRIENRLREIRDGKLNDPRFGHRMRGTGTYWETVRSLFKLSAKRAGFDKPRRRKKRLPFRVPARPGDQLDLRFDEPIECPATGPPVLHQLPLWEEHR
jgi:DNA repair photolyase